MTTKKEKILSVAIEILKEKPGGLRYSELVKNIQEKLPEIPINTIHGTVWNLEVKLPREIYKPARGIFIYKTFRESSEKEQEQPQVEKTKEEDFYQPFADWLINEVEECTKAIPLGGNLFKDKWGTPDVIGIREPRKSDIVKPPTEIVSAEIKTDSGNLITAFGQACAYKIFSHKTYMVVPKESTEEDIARLDALSRIFGVGLVLFNNKNHKTPEFEIRVRATKHDPDMFYVNKYMKTVEDDLFS